MPDNPKPTRRTRSASTPKFSPYRKKTVDLYRAAGWGDIFPIFKAPDKVVLYKSPPATGYTGYDAKTATDADHAKWLRRVGRKPTPEKMANIAWHVEPGYLVIDVDQYGKKNGVDLLKRLTIEAGVELPPTIRSTSRGADVANGGKYIYKLPEGTNPRMAWRSNPVPGVELLHPGHRYMVMHPSRNATNDYKMERWYRNNTELVPMGEVPALSEAATVTVEWVEILATGKERNELKASGLNPDETMQWLNGKDVAKDDICAKMRKVLDKCIAFLAETETGTANTAHDAMIDAQWQIINLTNEGHRGALEALELYADAWVEELNSGRHQERSDAEAMGEWRRGLYKAVDKTLGTPEKRERARENCACGERQQYHLQTGPRNAEWLRERLGTGALSSALVRGQKVLWASALGEDGYVEPENKEDVNGPATMAPLSGRQLSTRLSKFYEVGTKDKDDNFVEKWFPIADAERVLETPEFLSKVRPLRRITHTPLVRGDGSLLTAPGYDEASQTLHLPSVDVPPVPEYPTERELENATALLRGMVDEFDWMGKHDEANFFGLLLTPLLRDIVPPPYKLCAIMSKNPGSGKSLLNWVARELHGGVFRTEMPHDDAELAKSITSILVSTTAPVVQFDNVSGVLRSSRLAGLLTSAAYSDRTLGKHDNPDLINDRLWTITGNNVNLGGDLPRRVLWVAINPGCPNPHLRTGFRLNLKTYVPRHRGELLAALLTWVRAWCAEGQPRPAEESSDDYALWIPTVRGILDVAGVPGTFDHVDSARQKVGTDDEGWGEFLAAIRAAFGDEAWLARELVERIDEAEPEGLAIREHLPEELRRRYRPCEPDLISKSLGKWLGNRDGRWADGLVCEEAGKRGKTKLWRVRSVDGD